MNYIVGSNPYKFFSEYRAQLDRAVREYPQEYAFPVTEVPAVFERMRVAVERQSFNKDSRAIRATCKALGIKHTYTAIREYLTHVETVLP